jgi:glycosyltransferase involved in cell wall biosynthesis
LAPDLESISELVRPGETGMRFAPGDAADLAAKASLLVVDDAAYRAMRRRCRALYEERYTDTINYEILIDIYRQVCASGAARSAFERVEFA